MKDNFGSKFFSRSAWKEAKSIRVVMEPVSFKTGRGNKIRFRKFGEKTSQELAETLWHQYLEERSSLRKISGSYEGMKKKRDEAQKTIDALEKIRKVSS